MTTIVTSNMSKKKANYPFLLEDTNIESLLMFNYKNLPIKQKDIVSNRLFVKRSDKVNLTVKPLSNFAPTMTLSPRVHKK